MIMVMVNEYLRSANLTENGRSNFMEPRSLAMGYCRNFLPEDELARANFHYSIIVSAEDGGNAVDASFRQINI